MLSGTATAADALVLLKVALGVVEQDLLAFTLVKDLAGLVVIQPVPVVVFGEHPVQEVSVIVVLLLRRSNRRRVVLDYLLIVILQKLVATLGD